jgi:hypothetical protein
MSRCIIIWTNRFGAVGAITRLKTQA